MNLRDQAELEMLKRRQEAMQKQPAGLTVDIEQLSSRLNAAAVPAPEIVPLDVSPLNEPIAPSTAVPNIGEKLRTSELPPPLPPIIPAIAMTPAPVAQEVAAPEILAAENLNTEPPPISPLHQPPIAAATPPPIPPSRPRETFEMKLGTYWLVRIGIVMLLTGLVFLGTYAYKNYIGKFGPPGKVAVLYAASAALLGFGGWLQRKRVKESLRNYGQVLFAGGLAAVYFTTYAAHYVEALRIIPSPVVDGLLLLAWAAITVWMADRRKSEVLALFAVGLAYYTSGSTHVGLIHTTSANFHLGHFTLASNLVLTAAAVFFLVRNRWTTLSFISLLATYGGFAFWRFYNGDWSWDARTTGLWSGNFFLGAYWLFFTAAVFLSRGSAMVNANRSLFASLNNGAFFGLVLLSMMHHSRGHFWIFSLVFGVVLLGASLLARMVLSNEPVVKNTYLVQGLTLVTLGFISHYSGLQLALILAAESVVLTFLGHQQKNVFVRAGGYVTALLSATWVLGKMTDSRTDVLAGIAIGVAFLLNAWREHYKLNSAAFAQPFRAYFVALAVGVCGIVTWHATPEQWRGVAWLVEAVVLTAVFYGLRLPELPVFGQTLALAAQAHWLLHFAFRQPQPSSVPAVFVGGTLVLLFLGHQQKNAFVRASAYLTAAVSALWVSTRMTAAQSDLTIGAAMSAAFLLSAWWEQRHDARRADFLVRPATGYFVALSIIVCAIVTWHAVPAEWRAVAWMLEALAFTLLFYAVKIPELPLFSQGLALASQGFWFFEFALQRGQSRPSWLVPATLVAGTLALSHWWQKQKRLAQLTDLRNVLQIVYALGFVGIVFFWLKPDFGPAAWLAFLCVLAMGLTIYGVATRAWALAACAQLFLLISSLELFHQFFREKPTWSWALAPLATWLVLGVATTAYLSRHDTRDTVRRPLLHLSTFYRAIAFLMALWWVWAYVAEQHYFWVLCSLGLLMVAVAGAIKNREALLFGGLFFAVAFTVWFVKVAVGESGVKLPNALALIGVLALQQTLRRLPERFALPPRLHSAVIVLTGIALWTFVSRWIVIKLGTHFLLTVSWAALAAALFLAGFALRERMHRWLGLAILACSIVRVFASDVWKLETVYRILSFMALGIVLLGLGFIYNKYQDKIRQWL